LCLASLSASDDCPRPVSKYNTVQFFFIFFIFFFFVMLITHTEDALSETVNNYYIVAAHVIPGEAEINGVFAAREEKFEALAYAGHLPGYASGHNDHGLVFSINTIFVSEPLRGRIRESTANAKRFRRISMFEHANPFVYF